jgi:hypothetical protein
VWRLAVREVASAAIYFSVLLVFISRFGILAIGIAALVASGLQGIFFLPISIRRYRATAPEREIPSSPLSSVAPATVHLEAERERAGTDPADRGRATSDIGSDHPFSDATLLQRLVTRRTVSMALVAVDVAVLVLTLAHVHGPARLVLGLVLGAFIPGWSLIGPFKLAHAALEVTLAVAMSFVLLMLTAQVLITVHEWHLLVLEEVTCVLCLPSLLWQSRPTPHK